jgi:hypothetical protein
MWIGAVDGLRLNNFIYDFEFDGVRTRSVSGAGAATTTMTMMTTMMTIDRA